MKKNILILYTLIFALLFSSCQKEVLLKKDGIWDYKETYTETSKSTGAKVIKEESGVMTFNEEGAGNKKNANGTITTFTWLRSGNILKIDEDVDIYDYTVTTDKKKLQEMTFEESSNWTIYTTVLKLTR